MRKNLVRAAAILGSATALLTGSLVGSGCGGDDTVVAVLDGATPETSMPDVGIPDGMVDGSVIDAGPDTGRPPIDAGAPTLATFNAQQAQIFCQTLAACCFGSDVSRFNLVRCTTLVAGSGRNIGWTGSTVPFLDGGHVAFDGVKAQACFDDINSMGCGAIPSATVIKIASDCLAAVPGTIPAGSTGCAGSPECVPPAHCEMEAGTGTCVNPRALGAGCGGLTADEDDSTCGRLVSGPGICLDSRTFLKSNTCQPQQPLDAGCNVNEECQSELCGRTMDPVIKDAGGFGACTTGSVFATAGLCTFYTIPDAGPADAGPG